MPKYEVLVSATIMQEFEIEADSPEEAEEMAEQMDFDLWEADIDDVEIVDTELKGGE